MSRRVVQDDGTNVSLLPFLAVLICTMGALIILLVVVVQQARVSARTADLPSPNSEEVDAPPPGSNPTDEATDETELPVASVPHDSIESVGSSEEESQDQDSHDGDKDSLLVETQRIEQLQSEREELVRKSEMLRKSRDETNVQLADRRTQLSHVDSHARALQSQWETLQDEAKGLEHEAVEQQETSSATAQRLKGLRQEIVDIERELEETKTRIERQSRSFAVVPYVGPNGTVRRPFYIECLGDHLVLQPEGIRLDLSDLSPPLGPANPLVAALRQKRQWLAQQQGGQLDTEPYPLLIVRPDGSSTYERARVALHGWGTEFGYELIEADRPLVYPPVDPGAIPGMQEAIAQARQRQTVQRAVAQSAARQRSNRGTLRASRRGGFVHYDGRPLSAQDLAEGANAGTNASRQSPPNVSPPNASPSLAGTPSSPSQARSSASRWPAQPPGVAMSANSSGSLVTRSVSEAVSTPVLPFLRGDFQNSATSTAQPPGRRLTHPRELPAELEPRAPQEKPGGSYLASGNPSALDEPGTRSRRDAAFDRIPRGQGDSSLGNALGSLADHPASWGEGKYETYAQGEGAAFGNNRFAMGEPSPVGDDPTHRSAGQAGSVPPTGRLAGDQAAENVLADSRPAEGRAGNDGSARGGASKDDAPAGGAPEGGVSEGDAPAGGSGECRVADGHRSAAAATGGSGLRGAVLDAAPDAFAIMRPITISCELQRMVIMPEAGSRDRPVEIRFDGNAVNMVESVAMAIRQRIEDWGIAGPGAYWKPVLQLSVASGAEQRFFELQFGLRGTGIEVLRRQTVHNARTRARKMK